MSPIVALVIDWAVTALWPLIGAFGMVHYSGSFGRECLEHRLAQDG